jgi:hypothetical protein
MRKLSFEENLRHRLQNDVPRFRYRDERTGTGEGLIYLAIGAAAGIAAGVVVAQKFGGFSALATTLRERFGIDEDDDASDLDDEFEDDDDSDAFDDAELSPLEELEERVLEAYHNDPILSERAIDIGAIDEGIIELTGWVYAADEAEHAVTIARGTPGVETVLNRLAVREEEDQLDDTAERYEEGDDRLTESHWEGQGVGMGRRRQGHSGDPERHEDPKPGLEDRWLSEEEAFRSSAGPVDTNATGRKRSQSRRGGSSGTPDAASADDVAGPDDVAPPA